ncbi:MAG: hypothetical protein KAG66_21845 [Methylococcales bacterium]|nr:hypothetical protein [Methylococcales bacterium]
MRWILSIPLFLYMLIAANAVMVAGPLEESMMNVILVEFLLPSGRNIILTVSDTFILTSVFFLYIETFKATRTSVISIIDHALSLLVFVVFLIAFLGVPRLGNATFLIMMVCSLMDVVMGFTVTISTARRDLGIGGGLGGH